MRALTQKSITDITRRKLRSFLVILGVAISVLGITAILTANDTISRALAYSADRSAAPDIEIQLEQGNYSLATSLKQVANVKLLQIDSLYDSRWQINAAPGQVNITIYGYKDFQHIRISPFELVSGRYPRKGEIVLETGVSTIEPISTGGTVTLMTPFGNVPLKVVGFTRTLGLTSPASTGIAQGYVSDDTISLLKGHVADHIQVKVQNTAASKVTKTISDLTSVLIAHHIKIQEAHSDTDPFGLAKRELDGLVLATQMLAYGAMVLTCFLIINIMSTMIAEQTKAIGTMKAIGGTRGRIIRSYLLSVLIYGIVGVVLGIPLGLYAGYQLTLLQTSSITLALGPYQLAWWAVAIGVAIGIVVPLLAALIPLWTGTRITVREAMSSYGVKVRERGRVSSEHAGVVSRLPQTFWLGWRGVFRKPGRTTITLIALILAGIAFLAVQVATYSVQQYTLNFYAPYNYDVWATVNSQPLKDYETALNGVDNLKRIERYGQQGFTTQWGVLQVKAFDPATQMYKHTILSGRWLQAGDTNTIVLSDDVLTRSGLHVGDTIKITDQQNTSTRWRIIGTVHDVSANAGALGVGITSVNILNQFNKVPVGYTSNLIIQANNNQDQQVGQLAKDVNVTLTQANLNNNVVVLKDMITQAQNQFQPVSLLLYAFASLVGCVGLLTLINLLTTSVLERSREIGIWRSMGATGRIVAQIFWIEGASLSLLAWALSIILGIPAAYGFVLFLNRVLLSVSFAFDPLVIVEILAVIMVIMSLACLGPALNVARLRVVNILRYE